MLDILSLGSFKKQIQLPLQINTCMKDTRNTVNLFPTEVHTGSWSIVWLAAGGSVPGVREPSLLKGMYIQ